MNIKQLLLQEHSKFQTDKIVNLIGTSPEKFQELMEIFFYSEWLLVQRSAWAVGIITARHPYLFRPYFDRAVEMLQQTSNHPAVIRNILRTIQDIEIPEHLQGKIVELCFQYISDPKVPGGIKAFSISTLENICSNYFELAGEVSIILTDRINYETPAFVSRAKRFLKKFPVRQSNKS